MTALFLSVLTFFSTAVGGLFALRRRNQLYLVMGFSAGILVTAAVVDLLPDALEFVDQANPAAKDHVFLAAALGFLLYYSLDFFVHLGAAGHEDRHEHSQAHSHSEHDQHHAHNHAHKAFGSIAALGLTVHSFLDGFAIGGAFQASAAVGLLVAIAVLAHDFGDGVTTVGVVLGSRGGLRASMGWLLADAIAPVVGCATGLAIPISPSFLAILLGFFAGSFLFIGAAHLLPEAEHEGKAPWLYLAVVAGFSFVVIVNHFLSRLR
jgi:ZIP family zinc transporter